MDSESELLTIAYMQGAASKADEIRALRAERDALKAQVEAMVPICSECYALRADADRYRWLLKNCADDLDDGTRCLKFYCDFDHYDDIQAAIDAARGG